MEKQTLIYSYSRILFSNINECTAHNEFQNHCVVWKKIDRQRRLWNEWLHVHESVKQDFVWAKESIHYISILNFLCTLSLLLHNIHVSWPLPAYLDLPVLLHQQDGIPLDERSINCLPSLLLEDTNCFQSFVLTAPPQWNSLYACLVHVGKSIQLEHRFLEWTFRVKGMHWLFFFWESRTQLQALQATRAFLGHLKVH